MSINIMELPKINYRGLESFLDNYDAKKELELFDEIYNNKIMNDKLKSYYKKINKEEITLSLNKKANLLNGIVCYEKINVDKLNKLMDSNLLRKDFRYELLNKIYDSEKEQLTKYMNNMNKLGIVKVIYKKKSLYSRSLPEKSLGLHCIRREIRNTICKDYYIDIDIDNCHPEILIQICKSCNIKLVNIEHYVNDRESILKEICETYNIKRDDAKILCLRLMFSGSFEYWKKDQLKILNNNYDYDKKKINENKNINEDERLKILKKLDEDYLNNCNKINNFKQLKILEGITKDIENISKVIKDTNKDIITDIINKIKKNKDIDENEELELNNKENKKVKSSSVLATYLQEIESRLLETIYEYLVYIKVINNNDCVLAADGIMIKKEKYRPEILKELQQIIKYKYNFDLKLSHKEPKDYYTDNQIEESILEKKKLEKEKLEKEREIEKQKELENPESYENIKKEFEETHFKILNPSGFCIIDKDETNGIGYDIRFLDQKTLRNNYNNKYYLNLEKEKKEKFIQRWLDDENIKTYKN